MRSKSFKKSRRLRLLTFSKQRKLFLEHLESRELLAADWFDGFGWQLALNNEGDGAHGDAYELVDSEGNRVGVDGLEPAELADGDDGGDGGAQGIAPLADTFRLHSLPGATKTIMLDFDGHTTSGTSWNNGNTVVSPAYDPAGNGAAFTNAELTRIQLIWQRVAEDFAPFDVNVTTEDPGAAALSRSGGNDQEWGTRVVVTVDWANCSCGGFAYLNSFNDPLDEPVYVFNVSEIGVSAAASHEVGHALGLRHDGLAGGAQYYNGHGNGDTGWGPIMGSGYYRNMTTWDAGDYFNTSNPNQNDWQVITTQNGFGFRADDHSNSAVGATPLDYLGANGADPLLGDVEGFGVIELGTDTDWFVFDASGGNVNLTINSYVTETFVNNGAGFARTVETTPAFQGTNLDVEATLYDANMNVVATSNPSTTLNASFNNVAIGNGTHYIRIDGVGVGNWASNPPSGYDDSVSRGQFFISGTIPNALLIAMDDQTSTLENTPVDINVLANDSDPQGGNFWVSDLGTPTNGSVSETNGVVTYTPDFLFTGFDNFTYEITDDQGHTANATVTIEVVPSVLLIDDDQGQNYERFYADAMNAIGRGFNTWDVSVDGIPNDNDISAYSAIVWNTGYDFSSPDAGLSTAEENVIANFLDNGGGAFIVGQDILYNGVSPTFRTDYLKVQSFTGDIRGLAGFAGVPGNTVGDGLNLPFQLPNDFPADWSDTLAPTPDAAGVFYRNIPNGNAQPYNTVSYTGDDFRMVFMAAPFEGISADDDHPNNQAEVMDRILNFILGSDNRSPIATDNTYNTQINTAVSGNAMTDPVADSDPDGDPIVALQTPDVAPTNGTLVLQTNGDFTYTPDFNFNGVDYFVYTINDNNGGSDTGTVTINVGSNRPPVAVDDAFSTLEDNAVGGSLVGNDSDPDGDPLTVDTTPVSQPQNGSVTILASGAFTFTPDQDFYGVDSFVYQLNDDEGMSDTATVTINVTPVNDHPTVNSPSNLNLTQDDPQQTVNLSGITAGGGETQTLSVTATSDNTALIPNPTVNYTSANSDGTLQFTPQTGQVGEANITVTVTDDGGTLNGGVDTYSVTFKVTVTPPSTDWMYFSPKGVGSVGGVNYDQQDIIAFDGVQFTKHWEGTSHLGNLVIDAFAMKNQDFFFSFTNAGSLGGVSFDDSDIVSFDPDTESWSLYFDGSDVGLTRNGEDIDGFSFDDSGNLLISTNGSARVSGLQSADEDVLMFAPTSTGVSTSGAWSMFMDGSDIGLSQTSSEDVDGFSFFDGAAYLSTIGSFNVGTLAGADEDVAQFNPTQTGANTTGAYQNPLTFDGSAFGFTNDIGSLHVTLTNIAPGAPEAGAPEPGAAFGGEGSDVLAPSIAEPVVSTTNADALAPALSGPASAAATQSTFNGLSGLFVTLGFDPSSNSRQLGSILSDNGMSQSDFLLTVFAEAARHRSMYFANHAEAAGQDDDLFDVIAQDQTDDSGADLVFANWADD